MYLEKDKAPTNASLCRICKKNIMKGQERVKRIYSDGRFRKVDNFHREKCYKKWVLEVISEMSEHLPVDEKINICDLMFGDENRNGIC